MLYRLQGRALVLSIVPKAVALVTTIARLICIRRKSEELGGSEQNSYAAATTHYRGATR